MTRFSLESACRPCRSRPIATPLQRTPRARQHDGEIPANDGAADVGRPTAPAPDGRPMPQRRRCGAAAPAAGLAGDRPPAGRGPPAHDLVAALRPAETDPAALPTCDAALNALATIPRRRTLAIIASTLPPAGEAGAR